MFQMFLNVIENYVLMYTLYSFNLSNYHMRKKVQNQKFITIDILGRSKTAEK